MLNFCKISDRSRYYPLFEELLESDHNEVENPSNFDKRIWLAKTHDGICIVTKNANIGFFEELLGNFPRMIVKDWRYSLDEMTIIRTAMELNHNGGMYTSLTSEKRGIGFCFKRKANNYELVDFMLP